MNDIKVLDIGYDNVIKSKCIMAKANYKYAIEHLVPLKDRYISQRYTLKSKLYTKLARDIKNGCIMPPITIGINSDLFQEDSSVGVELFIKDKISKALILDGIQRLNVLSMLNNDGSKLPEGVIYLNIIVSDSMDRLLYRMVTLNNGQKPMSTRHQIEILAGNIYNFDDLNILIQTEKEQKLNNNGGFKKEDIIKAYLSFISGSTNIDNQKIIDSKLDELITEKIIDSDINERKIEFREVFEIINRLSIEEYTDKWFKVSNNLIGFSAGIYKSYNDIGNETNEGFEHSIKKLEAALKYFNISKVKLASLRRNSVKYFTENYSEMKLLEESDIADKLSIWT